MRPHLHLHLLRVQWSRVASQCAQPSPASTAAIRHGGHGYYGSGSCSSTHNVRGVSSRGGGGVSDGVYGGPSGGGAGSTRVGIDSGGSGFQ